MIADASRRGRSEKVVFLGAPRAGKTSLIQRIVTEKFNGDIKPTVGAAFFSKKLMLGDEEITLNIWDTGGQERYRSLAPMYFRGARAGIIVMDVTDRGTTSESEAWVRQFRESAAPDAVVFGAANKVDLVEERSVTTDDVKEFKFRNQIDHILETSALSGVCVQSLIETLGKSLLALPPSDGGSVTEDIPIHDVQEIGKPDSGECQC